MLIPCIETLINSAGLHSMPCAYKTLFLVQSMLKLANAPKKGGR